MVKQMRFCYANRRFVLFPDAIDSWNLRLENYSDGILSRIKGMGFDALEIGVEAFEPTTKADNAIMEFSHRVSKFGLKIGALRCGGTLIGAKQILDNEKRFNNAIHYATMVGAEIINGALSTPSRNPGHPAGSLPGSGTGWSISQDASRESLISVYEEMSGIFQGLCDSARENGITLSVEVHQNSPVDNSWSANLLCEKVNRNNFGINPDIGNVFWTYDVPEEDNESFITKCAPVAVYWHCKNLYRIYHPENQRAVFVRVPLPEGEIDYRFAVSAMAEAGFKGYMAIEGAQLGDQWYSDLKSLKYAQQLWSEVSS